MKFHHGDTEIRRENKARRRFAQMSADLNELTKRSSLISVHLRLSAATFFCFSPCLRVSVVSQI
jgi:hypothetical protein